jgi:hypothetical protein
VDRQPFFVRYDDDDREECDFQELMDILIKGLRYGDAKADDGKTRREKFVGPAEDACSRPEVKDQLWSIVQEKAHAAYDRYE